MIGWYLTGRYVYTNSPIPFFRNARTTVRVIVAQCLQNADTRKDFICLHQLCALCIHNARMRSCGGNAVNQAETVAMQCEHALWHYAR